MRFLRETKSYKKIIKSTSYIIPVAGILMIRQEKKHETTPLILAQKDVDIFFTRKPLLDEYFHFMKGGIKSTSDIFYLRYLLYCDQPRLKRTVNK